jgi:hypothetical protein
MSKTPPIFSIFCIDYRFDAMVANFYENTGKEYDYFACTVAGGSMPLGYESYCKNKCNKKPACKCKSNKKDGKSCNPSNPSMKLLKKNLVENVNIALTLYPVTEIFLLNHQDCGAIKGFLACSGYPTVLGADNKREIKINSSLLIYAHKYMKKQFPKMSFTLGFVDINGSVATFNAEKKLWTVIYVGEFNIKEGTWYGLKVGSTYKV